MVRLVIAAAALVVVPVAARAGAVDGPQTSVFKNPQRGDLVVEFKGDEVAAVAIWVPAGNEVEVKVLDAEGKAVLSQKVKKLGVVAWPVEKQGKYLVKIGGEYHYATN